MFDFYWLFIEKNTGLIKYREDKAMEEEEKGNLNK
jgi:hypothetical protein